jgi:hypothetical protein
MSEFTEERKAEILAVFKKITEDDKEKYNAYHDLYHALMEACWCQIPEDKVLPEREDLQRFLKKKMADHEVHGRVHERLIKLVENLSLTNAYPTRGTLFRVFNDPKDYNNALRGNHYLAKGTLRHQRSDDEVEADSAKRSRKGSGDTSEGHKKQKHSHLEQEQEQLDRARSFSDEYDL